MAERCIKGDYIGFTFGGVHSSELGLMRVSDGSRYNQDLLPPLQDKTAQVNGRDGAVYFGSQYNTRPIKVPVAFDNMTEESFNQLKRLLQDKKPKYLWFDETPYKQWLVKAANVQNFKWVCFDESHNGKEKRIYKGEGTLEFSCFSPYAESRVTFLDDEVDNIIYKEKKQLKVGNPPFLEVLTIEDNGSRIDHIYSEAIRNQNIQDNIFNIPDYGLYDESLALQTEGREPYESFLKYYEERGYVTLVESAYAESLDSITSDASTFITKSQRLNKKENISNIKYFSEGYYRSFRCYIITDEQKETIKQWLTQENTSSITLRNCQNYGIHYPHTETITILRTKSLRPKLGGSYYNRWECFSILRGESEDQALLLSKDPDEQLCALAPLYISDPIYPESWPMEGSDAQATVDYEIKDFNQHLKVKIVSAKGFIKTGNSIQKAKNNLKMFYNYIEWKDVSKIRNKTINGYLGVRYNEYIPYSYQVGQDLKTIYAVPIYNAGDKPADLKIILSEIPQDTELTLKIFPFSDFNNILGSITIKPISVISNEDQKLVFDSKLKLIRGAKNNGELTNSVYNKFKQNGDFFQIPTLENENDFYVIESSLNIPFEVEYKHHYI